MVEIDLAFPEVWVAVECDGMAKYQDRRTFAGDRRKWTQLSRDWSLVWVEWTRWTREPHAVLDEIAWRVRSADRSRPPAQPAR